MGTDPSTRDRRRAVSIRRFVTRIQVGLEESFPGKFWIEGEVSGLSTSPQGHLYFSLKEEKAQVSVVVWASRVSGLAVKPADGMAVVARVAKVDFYGPSGRLSLHLDGLEACGEGQIARQLEANRKKFQAEGLFAEARKRALPFLPRTIGVVTARQGAVIHDIRRTIELRFPERRILLRPARVQGPGAARDIAEAIDDLNQQPEVDVLIIGRGGGSVEDLWAFNEEAVVRAIARSEIPVISAVGHESDWSLADAVADVRAATPTAAAQMAVPIRVELENEVAQLARRLDTAVAAGLEKRRSFLERAAVVLRDPERLVVERRSQLGGVAGRLRGALLALTPVRRRDLELFGRMLRERLPRPEVHGHRLDDLSRRMLQSISKQTDREGTRLASLGAQLDALSPLAVLDRGFALARRSDGSIVREAASLKPSESLHLRLAQGAVSARVEKIFDTLDVDEENDDGKEI
ncbi:MAG: exodeoxyribonuclease VII large subunit [Candidatus Binatia bacterium]|nr:exodeoxyribonuclease VII large subunit [Candidatus Binatia bacterium]MDG2009087.1 exodeoxyribonuclease VII large subunit [Candidatus Binatia bacterium]